eukprot:16447303-Heterocapsa_arctica.AAC.1
MSSGGSGGAGCYADGADLTEEELHAGIRRRVKEFLATPLDEWIVNTAGLNEACANDNLEALAIQAAVHELHAMIPEEFKGHRATDKITVKTITGKIITLDVRREFSIG